MSTKISSANATRVCFSVIYNAECVYISKRRERFTYTIYTVHSSSSSSSSTHSDMLSRFHIHCAFSWTSRSMVSHTNRRAAFGCLEMLVLIFSCDQVSVYERFGPRFVSFIWFAWCVCVCLCIFGLSFSNSAKCVWKRLHCRCCCCCCSCYVHSPSYIHIV